MLPESTTRAIRAILVNYEFADEASSWPEEFAVKRYLKKMELPDEDKAALRREACFAEYVAFDQTLRRDLPFWVDLPFSHNWRRAKQELHKVLRNFRLAPVSFTNGSESRPTGGLNSVESKLLRSAWECSYDCWWLWASTAYGHLAIKRATRKRFSAKMLHDKAAIRAFHAESYRMFAKYNERAKVPFLCFQRMLREVTRFRDASRFTTVRKNNLVDRPIDVQPLCNMVCQRRIGIGIRNLLREEYGIELETLQDKHQELIQYQGLATLDLKNASDSVSRWLCRYLLPPRFYSYLERTRMPFVEGLDGEYYLLEKISSMGCGWTFELMTLILTALGRQHDPNFSVYGDDIITSNPSAEGVIQDLQSVGFVVNREKSFVYSKFRESCGANYHDGYGYIGSFDFEYPQNDHDVVVCSNKAFALGTLYPQFKKLSQLLLRAVPKSMQGPPQSPSLPSRGGWSDMRDGGKRLRQDVKLSNTFWSYKTGGDRIHDPQLVRGLRDLHYEPHRFTTIWGLEWKPEIATPKRKSLVMRRHTGKYMMYLQAGRAVDDGFTDVGSWRRVAYLTDGKVLLRAKSLGVYNKLTRRLSRDGPKG